MKTFFSHGKLLLTAEYVVLDQALALAVPTRYGQHLEVTEIPNQAGKSRLSWRSYNNDGELWYAEDFITEGAIRPEVVDACNSNPITDRLISMLEKARELNPDFLKGSYDVSTKLDFPNNWGLGSSSTLICNIAKWAQVDAFELSEASIGGSGYDIAVGMLGGDVLYRSPEMWEGYVYNPPFKEQLYLVHLNQKQDSREGIKTYRNNPKNEEVLARISAITEEWINAASIEQLGKLMEEHEALIAKVTGQETVKDRLFSDYPFAIKSLGAWGGDFILVVGDESTNAYFEKKGFQTVLRYSELIK
jgi:mevalonate kinase